MVPDFRLRLPTPEGLADHLAELKFVSAGVTWFPRGVRGKGTDKRALQRLDSPYHHTAADQTGLGSKDLHTAQPGQDHCRCHGGCKGREISDKELRSVVAQVRKYLSVTFIRAQSLCLLNSLGFLGERRRQLQGGGTWQRG